MGVAQLLLTQMNAALHQSKRIFKSALTVPSECKVGGHAGQRVGMINPELSDAINRGD
jgi:hypothetical protein